MSCLHNRCVGTVRSRCALPRERREGQQAGKAWSLQAVDAAATAVEAAAEAWKVVEAAVDAAVEAAVEATVEVTVETAVSVGCSQAARRDTYV